MTNLIKISRQRHENKMNHFNELKGIKTDLMKNIENLKKRKEGHVFELRRYEDSIRLEIKDNISKLNKQMAKNLKSCEDE